MHPTEAQRRQRITWSLLVVLSGGMLSGGAFLTSSRRHICNMGDFMDGVYFLFSSLSWSTVTLPELNGD